jgi:hypothetical protein
MERKKALRMWSINEKFIKEEAKKAFEEAQVARFRVFRVIKSNYQMDFRYMVASSLYKIPRFKFKNMLKVEFVNWLNQVNPTNTTPEVRRACREISEELGGKFTFETVCKISGQLTQAMRDLVFLGNVISWKGKFNYLKLRMYCMPNWLGIPGHDMFPAFGFSGETNFMGPYKYEVAEELAKDGKHGQLRPPTDPFNDDWSKYHNFESNLKIDYNTLLDNVNHDMDL